MEDTILEEIKESVKVKQQLAADEIIVQSIKAVAGQMVPLCDRLIAVPSASTPRIQETHLLIEHILCGLGEKELFGKNE